MAISERNKEQFIDDVLNTLTDSYTILSTEETVTGQAVSSVAMMLRSEGWRKLPRPCDFETQLEELGFTVRAGRNSRGNKARVVYL